MAQLFLLDHLLTCSLTHFFTNSLTLNYFSPNHSTRPSIEVSGSFCAKPATIQASPHKCRARPIPRQWHIHPLEILSSVPPRRHAVCNRSLVVVVSGPEAKEDAGQARLPRMQQPSSAMQCHRGAALQQLCLIGGEVRDSALSARTVCCTLAACSMHFAYVVGNAHEKEEGLGPKKKTFNSSRHRHWLLIAV